MFARLGVQPAECVKERTALECAVESDMPAMLNGGLRIEPEKSKYEVRLEKVL